MGTTAKTVNSAAISMIGSGTPLRHEGMKLVANRRSTDPMIYRARRMPRLEIRPSRRTRRGISHLHERGAGWSSTPSIPTRPRKFFNFSWDPLSQIFWKIKIVLLAYSPQVFGYGVSGYSFRARTILSPQRSIARSTACHDRYVPSSASGARTAIARRCRMSAFPAASCPLVSTPCRRRPTYIACHP